MCVCVYGCTERDRYVFSTNTDTPQHTRTETVCVCARACACVWEREQVYQVLISSKNKHLRRDNKTANCVLIVSLTHHIIVIHFLTYDSPHTPAEKHKAWNNLHYRNRYNQDKWKKRDMVSIYPKPQNKCSLRYKIAINMKTVNLKLIMGKG